MKHTPTPWKTHSDTLICTINGEIAEASVKDFSSEAAEANAAHIVKCVNLHEELVRELRDVSDKLIEMMYDRLVDESEILELKETIDDLIARSEAQ